MCPGLAAQTVRGRHFDLRNGDVDGRQHGHTVNIDPSVCRIERALPPLLDEFFFKVVDLVSKAGGVFETEVGGGLLHFLFEDENEPFEF